MAESKGDPDSYGAVVLIGGASTRMGRPKWKLQVNGESLLDRTIRVVASTATRIVVSAQPGQVSAETLVQPEGVVVSLVADQNPDCGPIEGIRAGLQKLHDDGRAWAFVTAIDVPNLHADVIWQLFSKTEGVQAVVPVEGDRVFGMTAVYRTDLHKEIGEMIAAKQLRVSELARRFKTRRVSVDEFRQVDPALESFDNINYPEQYEAVQRRFNEVDR